METNSILSYNKQIDGLRCFAVIGVLVFHFIHFENIYIGRLPFGQGVNLFFVISGYLITKILLINREKVKANETTNRKAIISFYIRRSLRIFPIYYLTIIYLLIINFQNIKDVWVWLVTYTTNFYISDNHNPYIGSFNHLWSLAVEEQFYLIWPFLILFLPFKYLEKIIVSLIVSSLIFKIGYFYYFGSSTAINALTISCGDSLGFGALIGFWSLYRKSLLNKISKIRFIVLLSFLPFAYFIIYPRASDSVVIVGNNFLFSIFAFFIVIKASQRQFSSVIQYILENRLVLHIGKISYGLYLYHFFMPDFYNQMMDFFPQYLSFGNSFKYPFLLISSLIFAECSWFLVERPMIKLKDKFQLKKKHSEPDIA